MTTEDARQDLKAGADLDVVVARFRGENSAANALYEARNRAGAKASWPRHVGLVQHFHHGTLALRGVFAGHFVDVDEGDHVSQTGAAEGSAGGALIGLLGGPPGLAVGLVLGALLGSQLGHPTDTELEPTALVDQLRAMVPRGDSAIVMIAPPTSVDELLNALADSGGEVIREKLTSDQVAQLNASLDDEGTSPLASE